MSPHSSLLTPHSLPKILCAASVHSAREAFAPLGDVTILPDRAITRDVLLAHRPDALVIRSKTPVTPDLVRGTSVQLVATATAGTDHIQTDALRDLGVAVASSPGCNANAVAEYIIAALALLADAVDRPLPTLRLGIVGCGHVGSRVAAKARAIGLQTLLNDPPLAEKLAALPPDGRSSTGHPSPDAFLPLSDLLPQADILTLHVPLADPPSPHPTRHLVDASVLASLPPSALLPNASRGAVVDSDALLAALSSSRLAAAIVDVWEREPAPHPLLAHPSLRACTPHIAGYSIEGLLAGTEACLRACADHFHLPPPPPLPPSPPAAPLELDLAGLTPRRALATVLTAACPIPADSDAWRAAAEASPTPEALRAAFDTFRAARIHRREYAHTPLRLRHPPTDLPPLLHALRFPLL